FLQLGERLRRFPPGLILLPLLLAALGGIVLYSAVGGVVHTGFLVRQGARFLLSFLVFLGLGLAEEKLFRRWAWILFGVSFILVVLVPVFGILGMGARRWLDLGFMRLQPSELMKITLILGLARYFHDRAISKGLGFQDTWVPMLMILLPMLLIARQPDLGTAVLLGALGGTILFVAGLPWKAVLFGLAGIAASVPLAWNWLHDYQKQRIMTLFFPEKDPLGSGYHIIQSKIAVGSGGVLGKGFMAGSQSYLEFLPERHTDFIFSVLAEEWGFAGSVTLLGLYSLLVVQGLVIAAGAKDRFGMLVAAGVTALFSVQVIINIGMVTGMLPVVGIPLPLISYGGSSLVTVMMGLGMLAHVAVNSRKRGSM
ncbi:MAG: rod shape-determining protein RodA, partial [Magnetococcales bacterium]|nr:rod shape-determining protein RodA [Magnetococcales bacterium]